MPDSNLRKKLIRLAYRKPELRPHVLPLVTGKTAASEVPLQDLLMFNPWVKGLLSKLARYGFKDVTTVWSGIHGNIIEFKAPSFGFRLTPETLKALSGLPKVRWYEFGDKMAAVGIEGSWIDPDAY